MLYLSPTQPDDPNDRPYPIKRVPATGHLTAAITSQQPYGCYTHYWGGRTVPCLNEDCDPCKAGAPRRWHCYLAAYDHLQQLHFLLELTAAAAEKIYAFAHEHGTCRACHFQATRQPKTPNGRIHLIVQALDTARYRLPDEPDLRAILSRLWNIPTSQIETANPSKTNATVNLPQAIRQRSTNQPSQLQDGNGQ